MREEVLQWLTEIQALQTEVNQLRQALKESQQREWEWRRLYMEEASQRRTEAQNRTQTPPSIPIAPPETQELQQALSLEKAQHQATRENLTSVINDTVDQLAKARAQLRHYEQDWNVTPDLYGDRPKT